MLTKKVKVVIRKKEDWWIYLELHKLDIIQFILQHRENFALVMDDKEFTAAFIEAETEKNHEYFDKLFYYAIELEPKQINSVNQYTFELILDLWTVDDSVFFS